MITRVLNMLSNTWRLYALYILVVVGDVASNLDGEEFDNKNSSVLVDYIQMHFSTQSK